MQQKHIESVWNHRTCNTWLGELFPFLKKILRALVGETVITHLCLIVVFQYFFHSTYSASSASKSPSRNLFNRHSQLFSPSLHIRIRSILEISGRSAFQSRCLLYSPSRAIKILVIWWSCKFRRSKSKDQVRSGHQSHRDLFRGDQSHCTLKLIPGTFWAAVFDRAQKWNHIILK
jgi:hypothetical protein